MINFNFNKECTGCRACADACSQGCISFYEDQEGFAMPFFQHANCVDCGLCEKVCPALNNNVMPHEDKTCYAAYYKNDAIRHMGSSGSVFYAIAEYVIQKWGGAVYGAALDNNLQLQHTRATDLESVRLQMKSKYIQSNTEGVYKQVVHDLREGKEVLFVGTPCQCQALHNMCTENLRNKLLLIDFICHGVPSQRLFDSCIRTYEKENDCKVVNFSFREKTETSLRDYKVEYIKKDNEKLEEIGNWYDFPYCNGYLNHFINRRSCYKCKQRSVSRASDITLGDFWGIKELIPEMTDYEKGYSSIITNSEKGKQLIETISSCFLNEIQDGVSFVISHNSYSNKEKVSVMRGLFYFCLRTFGYSFCERHFLSNQASLFNKILTWSAIRIDKMVRINRRQI